MLFADRLIALREGRISFVDFYNATRNLWSFMSGRLLRNRNPGIGVGEEDVQQEMIVEAWRCVATWDSTRGVPIDRYVIFNANAKASHWLDAQREASQGGKLSENPTRAPKLGVRGSIGTEDTEESFKTSELQAWFEESTRTSLSDGDVAARLMDLDRKLDVLSRADRIVVEALCMTRNAQAAALYIYNHYPLRIAFELGSEQAATRLVRRVAQRLCDEPALLMLLEE
jgi:hypothetical protein